MFLLKKIVASFISPLSLSLEILILGLFCLWAARRARLGKALVTLGTVILLLSSSPFLSSSLLMPLENRYPALLHPEQVFREKPNEASPRWIVVLGGGLASSPSLPPNSQISEATLSRVVEGVRLHQAIPGSKLLLSGGRVFDPVPEAEVMAQTAVLLGVKPQDMTLEAESRDTAAQAEIIAKMLGREKFILVTSAAHMPRSMALFNRRSLNPIPAPTDFLARESRTSGPDSYLPGIGSLRRTQTALHEYLGLAWAWLRQEV